MLCRLFFCSQLAFSQGFIGNTALLDERFMGWLFKGLCVYLIVSIAVRVVVGWKGLALSLKDLKYWKHVTIHHMSSDEFDSHINKRTKPYRRLYIYSAFAVTLIYFALVAFVLYMPTHQAEGVGTSEEKLTKEQVSANPELLITSCHAKASRAVK